MTWVKESGPMFVRPDPIHKCASLTRSHYGFWFCPDCGSRYRVQHMVPRIPPKSKPKKQRPR